MAYASVMTFDERDSGVRVVCEHGKVYLYWQAATYVAMNADEARIALKGITDALVKLEAEQDAAEVAV